MDLAEGALVGALWDLLLGLAGGACCGAGVLTGILAAVLLWGRGIRTLGEPRQPR